MTFPAQIPDADASVDDACRSLVGFLDRLSCLGTSHAMDTLADADLTFSQMRVLFALGAHGVSTESMSVHQIADEVRLSLAAAGRTVDKLVGAGLVDRREDPSDRRVKRISLTADGRRIVDSQLTIKQDLLRDFVARLPAHLRTGLCAALDPIVDDDVDHFTGLTRPATASAS